MLASKSGSPVTIFMAVVISQFVVPLIAEDAPDEVKRLPLVQFQRHDEVALDNQGRKVPWERVVGMNMCIDGIAWVGEKGPADRILGDNTSVLVHWRDLASRPERGTLARVTGTLKLIRIGHPDRRIQSTGEACAYVLTDATYVSLERATMPFLVSLERVAIGPP